MRFVAAALGISDAADTFDFMPLPNAVSVNEVEW
jgi:hypothetical protein